MGNLRTRIGGGLIRLFDTLLASWAGNKTTGAGLVAIMSAIASLLEQIPPEIFGGNEIVVIVLGLVAVFLREAVRKLDDRVPETTMSEMVRGAMIGFELIDPSYTDEQAWSVLNEIFEGEIPATDRAIVAELARYAVEAPTDPPAPPQPEPVQ